MGEVLNFDINLKGIIKMKIVMKKGSLVVTYNSNKDKDLTWRKVKEFCKQKLNEIDNQ